VTVPGDKGQQLHRSTVSHQANPWCHGQQEPTGAEHNLCWALWDWARPRQVFLNNLAKEGSLWTRYSKRVLFNWTKPLIKQPSHWSKWL